MSWEIVERRAAGYTIWQRESDEGVTVYCCTNDRAGIAVEPTGNHGGADIDAVEYVYCSDHGLL